VNKSVRLIPLFLIGVALASSLLPSTGRAQTADSAPRPTNFDSTVPAPAGLPGKLEIPPNTHMEVKVWSKNPGPPPQPSPENDKRVLWAPVLLDAVFDRGAEDLHAVFHWEGNQTSEAFVIHGVAFNLLSFAFPDEIHASEEPVGFHLNRRSAGKSSFPGIPWYGPSHYVGTALLNGASVLVFAVVPLADPTSFPTGEAVCLDPQALLPVWSQDGDSIYAFTYTPASEVQIDPQGPYLNAVKARFGHWP